MGRRITSTSSRIPRARSSLRGPQSRRRICSSREVCQHFPNAATLALWCSYCLPTGALQRLTLMRREPPNRIILTASDGVNRYADRGDPVVIESHPSRPPTNPGYSADATVACLGDPLPASTGQETRWGMVLVGSKPARTVPALDEFSEKSRKQATFLASLA